LCMAAWNRPDKFQIIRPDSVRREKDRDLIEKPLIDCAGLAHATRVLVRDERLPKKFFHLAVDFSRSEVIVIEKNLKSRRRLLIVIRQRHDDFGCGFRRWSAGRHRNRTVDFLLSVRVTDTEKDRYRRRDHSGWRVHR